MKLNREVVELVKSGMALQAQGRNVEAFDLYDKLLARIDYDDPNLLMCYATLLATQGYPGLALQLFKKAIDAAPPGKEAWHKSVWSNYATALRGVERLEEAEKAHATALSFDPEDPHLLTGMANAFVNRNMSAKVVEFGRKAVAADPEYPNGHVALALGLLEEGKFNEAWPHYEYRWKLPERQNDVRPYKAPRWDGNRTGTLAIHGEQGLGDEIMFMAYFREAAKKADRVLIECAPRLVSLFQNSFGVPCYGTHDELVKTHGEPSAWVPMGSLPRYTGTASGRPYLKRAEKEPNPRPLIGLSWRGGTEKTNHTLRSIRLSRFAPILCADADFISLQYGPDDVDEEARQCDVQTLPDRSLETIVGAMSRCDLVITVCQTNVHLAGGMGIPCYVLTPQKSAWRYCRDRMEWYDSVELFKRLDGESWDVPIGRIANRLREKLSCAA